MARRFAIVSVVLAEMLNPAPMLSQAIRPSEGFLRFSDHSKYEWQYGEYLDLWRTMLHEIPAETRGNILVEFNRLRLLVDLRPGCPTENFALHAEGDALTYVEYPDSVAGDPPPGSYPTCSNGDDRFDLRYLKITANTGAGFNDKTRQIIWIECGLHGGHESSNQMASYAYIRNLLQHPNDPWVRSLLSQYIIVLFPSVNVNGNFTDPECAPRYTNYNNVNLITNFGYDFLPSSEPLGRMWPNCPTSPDWAIRARSHAGIERPFSEPEARILRDVVFGMCHPIYGKGHRLAVFLDMHNNGGDFVWIDPGAAVDGGTAMYNGVVPSFAAEFSSQLARYTSLFGQEINAAWNPFNIVTDPASPSESVYRTLDGDGMVIAATEQIDPEHPKMVYLREGNGRCFREASYSWDSPLKIGSEVFDYTISDRESGEVQLIGRAGRWTVPVDHRGGELVTSAAFPLFTERSYKVSNTPNTSNDWFAEVFKVNAVYMEPPAVWRVGLKPGMPTSNTEMMYVNFNYGVTSFIQAMIGDSLRPLLLSPVQRARIRADQFVLWWRSAGAGLEYEVQVASDSMFAAILFDHAGITDTTTTAENIPAMATSYWRIRCSGNGGVSAWSSPGSFELQPKLVLAGSIPSTASEDSLFSVPLRAVAAPALPTRVTYQLLMAPPWLTIDSAGGRLSGIPRMSDVGKSAVSITATDSVSIPLSVNLVLTVTHLNHPPAVVSDAIPAAHEDSLFHFRFLVRDADSAAFGDTLRFALDTPPPWIRIDSLTGELAGTPGGSDVGATSLRIDVRDGRGGATRATLPLGVAHTNHPPVVTAAPVQHAADDSMYVSRWTTQDPDSALFHDRLRYRFTILPAWLRADTVTGVLTGMPKPADVGTHIVTMRAIDDSGACADGVCTIIVDHHNHAPELLRPRSTELTVLEDSLLVFHAEARDPDETAFGDPLRFSLVGAPGWIAIDSVTGYMRGTPGEGDRDASFFLRVSDGRLSDTLQLTVHVIPVNDPPVLRGMPSITFLEDSSAIVHLDRYVSDPDNTMDQLKWTMAIPTPMNNGGISSSVALRKPRIELANDGAKLTILMFSVGGGVDSLRVVINQSNATACVSATHQFFADHLPLIFVVTDPGGLSARDTTFVDIIGVNDPPRLLPFPVLAGNEFDSVFVPYRSLYPLVKDPDDPDSVHTWFVRPSAHLRVLQTGAGVRCIPEDGWSGTEDLHIVVKDPGGLADSARWTVNIRPVPHPPIIVSRPDSLAYTEVPYAWHPRIYDRHPADTSFRYSVEGPPWLTVDSTGTLRGRPPVVAGVKVRLLVFDRDGASDTLSYILTVKSNDETRDLSGAIPTAFVLKQNYPNPFNPSTTLRFGFPSTSVYTLRVFNILGQMIEEVESGEREAGYHETVWNPRSLGTGVYIAVLEGHKRENGSSFRLIQKMLLMK